MNLLKIFGCSKDYSILIKYKGGKMLILLNEVHWVEIIDDVRILTPNACNWVCEGCFIYDIATINNQGSKGH